MKGAIRRGCHGIPDVLGSVAIGQGHAVDLLGSPPIPACDHPACVWLYLRFTLSYRDVEELLAGARAGRLPRDGPPMVPKFGLIDARYLRQ